MKKIESIKFGLPIETYNKIKEIIVQYPYAFRVFGSRARGNYKRVSDIDIAIFGEVNEIDKFKIRNEFDKLDLPYLFDLVFITEKTKKELLQAILKEGVDF